MDPKRKVLEELRLCLEGEKSSGFSVLPVSRSSHLASTPGSGQADNIADTNDAIDRFLADVADEVVRAAGLSPKEAAHLVFSLASSAEDEEHLPAIPDETADPEELASWLGKASTYGFAAKAVKAAKGR